MRRPLILRLLTCVVIGHVFAARSTTFLALSCTVFAAPAVALNAPADRTRTAHPYAAHIDEAAQRFAIPHAWIKAVIRVESAVNPRALSSAGAIGLMQIMPATWASLRVRHGLGPDPYDPRDNILAGTAYLREMHDRFGSPGFLASYNAGPKRYEDYLSRGRPLPAETRAYVATLAPIISSGNSDIPVAKVADDPHTIDRAPLFAIRFQRTNNGATTASGDAIDNAVLTTSVRDVSALMPPPGGLFIPRSGVGGAQ